MTFDDAARVPAGSSLRADVCIVGSGAAGLTLALRLAGTTLDVVLLEAGGMQQDTEAEGDTFDLDLLGLPQVRTIESRGRWFGGSTSLWFGRIAQLDPIDFEARSWVPHSGWPITEDEVRRWLPTAAGILDVPHFDKLDIGAWAPNPTIDMVMGEGGADLRPFLWADGMYMGDRARDALERSRNVRVLLGATATALVPNQSSSAIDSLTVVGSAGTFTVAATHYVLAAGGLENPRLLLASTARSAAGVGNATDNVGRYYMDHPRGEGLATADLRGLPRPVLERLQLLGEKSRSPYGHTQLRVTFPESMQREEELLNHSLHAHLVSDVQNSPGYSALRRVAESARSRTVRGADLPADLWQVAKASPRLAVFAARRLARRERPTSLVVIDQMEQVPDPSSRVTVDHDRRDRFGLPKVQLDWRITNATYESQRRMHEMFASIVARAGLPTFRSSLLDRPGEPVPLVDMKHPSGTTRMSSSPRDGVVDEQCRVHGIGNLYVAGTSVFPTVGHANPTLTIVALAARLAHHLGGPAADA